MQNVKSNAPATFQERLSKLLERPDVSQKKLADYVGVTRQAIGQWKDGKTLPDVSSFQKIAKFFKVSYEYLLGETDNKTTNLTITAICKLTGLNEDAVNQLTSCRIHGGNLIPIINNFLESDYFNKIISGLFECSKYNSLDLKQFLEDLALYPHYDASLCNESELEFICSTFIEERVNINKYKLTMIFNEYLNEITQNIESVKEEIVNKLYSKELVNYNISDLINNLEVMISNSYTASIIHSSYDETSKQAYKEFEEETKIFLNKFSEYIDTTNFQKEIDRIGGNNNGKHNTENE